MKIAVTVVTCHQIGIETWRDAFVTKVFDETSTVGEIVKWAKIHDKTVNISSLKFGTIDEQP